MSVRVAAEIIFWLSAGALFYTYVGYPLLIALVSTLRPRSVQLGNYAPVATMIITAYNEEHALAAKLENTLALDYPRDRVEILVISDGSTDRTDELVRALNSAIDSEEIGTDDVPAIEAVFTEFDRVLGIVSLRRAEEERPPVPVPEIEEKIGKRHEARRRRDFATADRIRDELAARGVLLEDNASGTRWKRK